MLTHDSVFVAEIGTECNNNCIFCMEKRRYPEKKYPFDDFKRAAKITSRINFARKEPTLNPKLAEYAKMAKIAGFKRIELTTNGRMLSIFKYAKSLADAGINVFQISLHGTNPRIHDALTRTPGSFIQTFKGILNVLKLRREKSIKIEILMTVTKINVNEIPKMVKLTRALNVDLLMLNIFDPIGEAKKFARFLLPKYSDVVNMLEKSNPSNKVTFSLPPCVVPKELRKFCSVYEILVNQRGKPIIERRRGKILLEKCQKCALKNYCDGVWREYIKIYGDREFSPISTREN